MTNKYGYPTDSTWKQNYVNMFLLEHPDLRLQFVALPLDTQYTMAMSYQDHVDEYSNTLLDDEDEELTPRVNKSGYSSSSYDSYNDSSADLYNDFGAFNSDSFDSFGGDGGLSGGGGADGSW